MERTVRLDWPRKEDEHVVMMNAWLINKERLIVAHKTALRQMIKDRSNPTAYRVMISRLLNNVQYPAEYE